MDVCVALYSDGGFLESTLALCHRTAKSFSFDPSLILHTNRISETETQEVLECAFGSQHNLLQCLGSTRSHSINQ